MEYYKSLLNSLERGVVSPVYLFYGEEEYLKEKALAKFKEVLLPQAADFNLDILDGETIEPSTVVSLAENLPFMAERRLVIVKNAHWFKGKGKVKVAEEKPEEENKSSGKEGPLLTYLSQPSPTTCLIFVVGDTVDRRKKLFKYVESVGNAIDFKALKPADLVSWVINRVKTGGKKMNAAAARTLVEANGKLGLLNLEKEVEKLMTYVGGSTEITMEDVNQVAVANVEQNIFTVVDQAVSGNASKALYGIRELLALKEQPPKILAMLARQFRLALQVASLAEEGCTDKEVARKLGLHDFAVRKALLQAKKTGMAKLAWAMEQLAQIDADIKKGRQEFLPAIENILITLNRK